MAREKFQTLTEQMFYVLLCLREECCGMDLMERIRLLTSGRVSVGPGTLYNLLEQFAAEGYIVETKCEGRRRSYVLTEKGEERLHGEMDRLTAQMNDYQRLLKGGDKPCELTDGTRRENCTSTPSTTTRDSSGTWRKWPPTAGCLNPSAPTPCATAAASRKSSASRWSTTPRPTAFVPTNQTTRT